MADSETEFIPDFSFQNIFGAISNRNSKIIHNDGDLYISIYNRVNRWDINSQELCQIYGSLKYQISTFKVLTDKLIIAYDKGFIEIIEKNKENLLLKTKNKILRLANRKITAISCQNENLICASNDGSIIYYDLISKEVVKSYKDNNSCVEKVRIQDHKIYALCTDKTIKIWKLEHDSLFDAIAFDDQLLDFFIRGAYIFTVTKTGKSFKIDLSSKSLLAFDNFKKPRNIKYFGDKIVIQCQKNLFSFYFSEEDNLSMKFISKMPSNEDFVDFDIIDEDEYAFISRKNKIEFLKAKSSSFFHEEEISQIEIIDSNVFSFSKDKIAIWNFNKENDIEDISDDDRILEDILDLEKSSLSFISSIEITQGNCFCIFNNSFVVGNSKGLTFYSLIDYSFRKEILIGKVDAVCAQSKILAVGYDTKITFYDISFNIVNELSLNDPCISIKFSPNNQLFCVACMDTKMYVYSFPVLTLNFTLYGHSLPVRKFSFSPESKTLLSCGADKLVKMWGMDFGECKKTFIGDANNVEFVCNDIFMIPSKEILYYKGFNRLKSFKTAAQGVISIGNGFFVASSGNGLSLYTINKYEYAPEEQSEEINPIIQKVASVDEYDQFLQFLELLENNFDERKVFEFYCFLENCDFNELMKYIYVLDTGAIYTMLKLIDMHGSKNTLLNARLFVQLFKFHKENVLSYPSFSLIKTEILKNITYLREDVGCNHAQISMDLKYENIELE